MPSIKNLLFVINPISGGKSKEDVTKQIDRYLDLKKFSYSIYWWEEVEGLKAVVQPFINEKGYAIVAVGGDGTINSIASYLVNSETRLAVVPMGSGNGLARELNISRNTVKALQSLNTHVDQKIDFGFINNDVFINVAGIGFDALVSHSFAAIEKRGFWSYAKAVIGDFGKTSDLQFSFSYDGHTVVKNAFMLSIANGTQWGSNFYVSPNASYSDGLLDFVFVRKPKLIQVPWFLICLYLRKNHSHIEIIQAKEARIGLPKSLFYHVDGEPKYEISEANISIKKHGVKLLAPK